MGALWLDRGRSDALPGTHRYNVAGLPWLASQRIASLEAFVAARTAVAEQAHVATDVGVAGESVATAGWLAGAQRHLAATYADGKCNLDVSGVGTFAIDPDHVGWLAHPRSVSRTKLFDTLVGPPLLIAMACHDHFALHASAARAPGHPAWVFVGDSGAGKSTLASFIGSRTHCQAIADDVLPVQWSGDELTALPWYPQLKLDPRGQYAGGVTPERLPVAAVYLLAPVEAREAVFIEALAPVAAAATLIRQTVAARLFSRELTARHFRAFSRVATAVPHYRLRVPRDAVRLPEVYDALLQSMEARNATRPPGVA